LQPDAVGSLGGVLSFAALATRPDFTVTTVTCRGDHTRWSTAEASTDVRLVFVRRGRFRRRAAGAATDVDPTVGYVVGPDEEEHFAHPAGGDVCTRITVAPQLWRAAAGETTTGEAFYVDPRLDLAHRRLLAAIAGGDVDYAAVEQLVGLVGRVATRLASAGGAGPRRGDRRDTDRALVDAARTLIGEDHPAAGGLVPLADLLGVSPYRLSRAFTRHIGVSVTRYRGRVRLGLALDRLQGGERSLATLAADLGFADQAHLTRTVTAELGHTPTALRRLL
jgi:AraC-like DNA-binding protein